MSAHPKLFTCRQEPLRFERLLIDLSKPFTNLAAERIDRTIEATQKTLCDTLELDHSTIPR
jgi:hypothetical protein